MRHLFLTDNLIEDASLSMLTGTENANYPLENINIPITSKVFRSTDQTTEILIDLKTINPIDTFAIVGDSLNGFGFTNISIYGSTTNGFSGATEISIDLGNEYNFGFKEFTEVSYRYWKIVLEGSTYCEISNIYLGKATPITTNAIALGSFEYSKVENVRIQNNKYGNRFITTYNNQKRLTGEIKLINNTELDTLREIKNDFKSSKPLFFITDPDDDIETDGKYLYSGYFYFGSPLAFKNTNNGLWSTAINLIEVV